MLYLVATPIGNLGDITLRAIETLRNVDYVAAEDTRKTGLLLNHLGFKKPQIAFHEHNERSAGEKILRLLVEGHQIALVTNAGTPGISDPGFTLVRSAIDAGIQVTSIPGPAAFVSALILSGLPVHSFTFRGFPPHKAGARRKFLLADQDSPYTLIYYESTYRIKDFLQDALAIFGDRPASLSNDLTKMFESVQRGCLSDIIAMNENIDPKGEYCVVIAGKER
jgi:16S rRNA (cytidine1402-2'-O)-methyltransferase